jgi:hypothetical protein
MMHQSSAVRRREITAESSNNDNNRWDAYIHVPVIIPGDTTHGVGSGSEIYRHHDHDNIKDIQHSDDDFAGHNHVHGRIPLCIIPFISGIIFTTSVSQLV